MRTHTTHTHTPGACQLPRRRRAALTVLFSSRCCYGRPLSLLESGDSFVMPPVPPTGVPEMEQLKSWGMQVLHLEREQMACVARLRAHQTSAICRSLARASIARGTRRLQHSTCGAHSRAC